MEKETTILIPTVQIESRSELLENSEKATIQNLADLNKNSLNDSTSEVKVENCSVLTGNAAALQTDQLTESNSSFNDSQWELFPSSNNLTNPDASSIISNNSGDEIQNQLTAKRNERVIKIASLINKKFDQDKEQFLLLAKKLTQEEIIQMTRQKIDKFEQVLDKTYVEIFDKFITSTQNLPEPKTSGFMEFYYNRFFGANQQQDHFAIEQFASECESTVESLFSEIKWDLSKITDLNKRKELINYFKQNKNKWCMNAYFTEKSLNALMHDNKHKTSQELDNITIKNGDNKTQVTPELFKKITGLTNECTNNMQIFGNTIYDKSNLLFEGKYRIERPKAEKYKLPKLIETANKISSTIGTWMTTQLY
jgi:hypothetical protein